MNRDELLERSVSSPWEMLRTVRMAEGYYPEQGTSSQAHALPVRFVTPAFDVSGRNDSGVSDREELVYCPTWHPPDTTIQAVRIGGQLYACPNVVGYCSLRYYEADGRTRWVRDYQRRVTSGSAGVTVAACVVPGSPDRIFVAGTRCTLPTDAAVSWSLVAYDVDGEIDWSVDLKDHHSTGNAIDLCTDGTYLYVLMEARTGSTPGGTQLNQRMLRFDLDGAFIDETYTAPPYGSYSSVQIEADDGYIYQRGPVSVAGGAWPNVADDEWHVAGGIADTINWITVSPSGLLFVVDGTDSALSERDMWVYSAPSTLVYYTDVSALNPSAVIAVNGVAVDASGNTYLATGPTAAAKSATSYDSTGTNVRWSESNGAKTAVATDGEFVYFGGGASGTASLEKRKCSDGSLVWRHKHNTVGQIHTTTDGILTVCTRSAYNTGNGSFI